MFADINYNAMRKQKERIKVNCKQCEKEYFKLECQLKDGKGRFCSKECIDKSRSNGSILKCIFCEKEFYRRFGEQKRIVKQYCSKECYSNDRILNAKKTTYLKEGADHIHRIVAEKALNRKLKKGEVVHHIDEDKHNNSILNLAVLPNQKIHAKVHFGNYDFEQYKLINLIKK